MEIALRIFVAGAVLCLLSVIPLVLFFLFGGVFFLVSMSMQMVGGLMFVGSLLFREDYLYRNQE